MGYRANPTDKQQDVLETAAFEAGVPVFEDDKTRVIAKGADGATEKTAHQVTTGSVNLGKNAGVVMPIGDVPNRFAEDTQGKA